MKKLSFMIAASALFLLGSCKKEDSQIDRNAIKLVVMEPIELTDPATVQEHQYILKAAIVAPGLVDITEHGFIVKANANSLVFDLPMGAAKKAGSVEQAFSSPFKKEELSITLYAILKNGDTLTSDGADIPEVIEIVPVYLAPPLHTPNKGTDERFYTTGTNGDTASFSVVEQGIEYEPMATFTGVYNGRSTGPTINDINGTFYPDIQIVPSSTLFTPGGSYYYRIYVVVVKPSTGKVYTIYSPEDTFIAVNP